MPKKDCIRLNFDVDADLVDDFEDAIHWANKKSRNRITKASVLREAITRFVLKHSKDAK